MSENKKASFLVSHADFEFSVDNLIPSNKIKFHPRFDKFLNIARSMSESSKYEKYRIGAILVVKGKIIARGFNAAKGNPLQKRYNLGRSDVGDGAPHYIHAEMDILRQIRNKDVDLKNAELFIFHINTRDEQRLARPCAACMEAIKDKLIPVIHYSTPNGFATEYISPDQKIIVNKALRPI